MYSWFTLLHSRKCDTCKANYTLIKAEKNKNNFRCDGSTHSLESSLGACKRLLWVSSIEAKTWGLVKLATYRGGREFREREGRKFSAEKRACAKGLWINNKVTHLRQWKSTRALRTLGEWRETGAPLGRVPGALALEPEHLGMLATPMWKEWMSHI